MTPKQGFLAMSLFMDRFWEARKAEFDDDLPSLLGSMMITSDGLPWDHALWTPDWTECLPSPETISPEQGFAAMVCFWEKYISLGEDEIRDISRLLEIVEASKDTFWQEWLQAVQDVTNY